jgi:hypothetical protein
MSSVEIISTETMRPASLARQKSVQFQQNMETPKAQAGGVIFNLISGIALPMYAAIVYSSYGDRPCDKPVAGWLYTYALLGFITGGAGLYINVQKLRIGPALQAAQALQDENAKAEAMAPYVGAVRGCIRLSCHARRCDSSRPAWTQCIPACACGRLRRWAA